MTRKFVILLDSSDKAQNEAFLNYAKEKDLGYWHWFNESWLIYDSLNKVSATSLRDTLRSTHPGVHQLVLEITHITWAGFGPSNPPRDMFEWIKKNWS